MTSRPNKAEPCNALEFVQTVIANKKASEAQLAEDARMRTEVEIRQRGRITQAATKHVLGPTLWDGWNEHLRLSRDGNMLELDAEAAAQYGLASMKFEANGDTSCQVAVGIDGVPTRNMQTTNAYLGEMLSLAREMYLKSQIEDLYIRRRVSAPEVAERAYAELKKWCVPASASEADKLFSDWRIAHEEKQQKIAGRAAAAQALAAYREAYANWHQNAMAIYEQNKKRIAEWRATMADKPLRYWLLKYAVVSPYDDGVEVETPTVVAANESPNEHGYWTVFDGEWVQRRYNHWVSVEEVNTTWSAATIERWHLEMGEQLTVKIPVQPGVSEVEMQDRIRAELQLTEIPERPDRPKNDNLNERDFSSAEDDVVCGAKVETLALGGDDELPF